MNQIILPNSLIIGPDSTNKISDILNDLNCKKPLIITDNTMVELDVIKPLEISLTKMQIRYEIFKDTIPEPTALSITKGVSVLKKGDYDCIIAFGGGSPIDSAKAISILAKYGGDISDYKFPNITNKKGLPIIAIPTTAGTGSEVTKFTIITNEKTDEKMLCVGSGFLPVAAIIDYKLTLTLPKRTSADTGIDALTHAMEAYISKKANIFSDAQALAAMKLIAPNLRKVYKKPLDLEARENLMIGATLAGLAFSNSSVALVHGMSRPIGAFYHVPHGLSNAMLLPTVTEYSIPAASKKYAKCSEVMGISSNNDDEDEANKKLIKELYDLNQDLEVPSIIEYGIKEKDFLSNLEIMAEQALASGSPNNNPKVPSIQEMISLYKRLL